MTVTTESREFLDPDEFADATESEALKPGRVLLAFTSTRKSSRPGGSMAFPTTCTTPSR